MSIWNWIILIGILAIFVLYMSIPIVYMIKSILAKNNPKEIKRLNDIMDEIMRDWPGV
jgi:accessory colonization factor AcfC